MKARPDLPVFTASLLLMAISIGSLSGLTPSGPERRLLSLLSERPDWSELDVYNRTMSREVFEERMNRIYSPGAPWQQWFAVSEEGVAVVTDEAGAGFRYFIEFADGADAPESSPGFGDPIKVVIDPGHIGGHFASLEQRWFQIGDDLPVAEGDLVLIVAQRLRDRLRSLGFEVELTREKPEPVTTQRPEDFAEEAARVMQERFPLLETGSPEWEASLRSWQNLLFYRVSEIRARADLINHHLRPDIVLALHINATAWPEPQEQSLAEESHFHLLLNGAYLPNELEMEDMRFHLLRKLLSREWERELPLALSMVDAFARNTGLPPFTYHGPNAVNLADNPYLWGRNLLANRLFECPVLFLEPYVANSAACYQRIQQFLRSQESGTAPAEDCIIEEYVTSVIEGLRIIASD